VFLTEATDFFGKAASFLGRFAKRIEGENRKE
jgi:hypothetical protein